MWIVSDGIIAAALAALIVLYLRGNQTGLVVGCIVCYCCLPAVRLGDMGINSAYVVTALLAVLFVQDCIQRRVRLRRSHMIYLGVMFLVLLVMALGWAVNGRPQWGDVVHFVGLSQYILGVFFLSVRMQMLRAQTPPERIIMRALPIVLGINAVFVLLQFISYPLSSWLLRLLYAYPGKTGPLDDFAKLQSFPRLFGANYTPLILAVIALLFCAFVLGRALYEGRLERRFLIWFFVSLSLGFLAFSKTVILGIVVLLICAVVLAALKGIRWLRLRYNGRVLASFALSTALVFALVAGIGFATGRGGQVKYYYGFLLSPLEALSTRYESIGNTPGTSTPDPDHSPDSPEVPPQGNVTSTFDVFLEHKLIGVGPAAVQGEFLGDSQFVLVLHDGGLLAFGLYALLYLWLLVSAVRAKDAARALIVLALAIGCLSMPILSYACTIPFVAYCLAAEDGDLLFDKKREA